MSKDASEDSSEEFVGLFRLPCTMLGVSLLFICFYSNVAVLPCSHILHHKQNSSKRLQSDESDDDFIIAKRVKQIERFKESVFGKVDKNIQLAQAHQKKL